jgi:hypothetical protein
MENENPNTKSNEDLEKDMHQLSKENDLKGNQENVNRSTAAEGDLISPDQDTHHKAVGDYAGDKERDLDDVVHQGDSQDGSVPDSEELSLEEEEDGYDDPDKISS